MFGAKRAVISPWCGCLARQGLAGQLACLAASFACFRDRFAGIVGGQAKRLQDDRGAVPDFFFSF